MRVNGEDAHRRKAVPGDKVHLPYKGDVAAAIVKELGMYLPILLLLPMLIFKGRSSLEFGKGRSVKIDILPCTAINLMITGC